MFPTTRQSIIERVQQGGDDGREALGAWFTAYRSAMCLFVVKCVPSLAHRAEEVVDGFITRKVLQGVLLTGYRERPGRHFRSRLKVALKNYCRDILRTEVRATRRRGGSVFSIDEEFDKPEPGSPDGFDVLWIRQVLGRAIHRMKRECRRDGSDTAVRAWGVFEARFLRPFRGKPEIPYPELVTRYGLSSPGIAQKAATEGKKMLAQALESVVSEYAGVDDARAEINELRRIAGQIGSASRSRSSFPRMNLPSKE